MAEIHELSAEQLLGAYRTRELSPVEVLEAVSARIDAMEPSLHAFITECRELAMSQARKAEQAWRRGDGEDTPPLLGVPVTLKDLVDLKGIPTSMGSLTTSGEPATRDELFVERLREAGAVFLGKTNTSEFGLAAQTMNRLGQPTANPWNLGRTAGGSSGGAAAGCAAGYGPLHHGTDGGGSVRVPAAYCGVIGLKPTGRRIPRRVRGAGMSQISTDGVLARSISDAALMLGVIAEPDHRDPGPFRGHHVDFRSSASPGGLAGVRVAYTTELGWPTPCEALMVSRVEAAANVLREAGASVSAASPGISDPNEIFPTLSAVGAAANYGEMCVGRDAELSDYTLGSLRRGRSLTGVQVAEAYAKLDRLRRTMAAWFEDFDILLTPSGPVTAPKIGQEVSIIRVEEHPTLQILARMTRPFNVSGSPAITVPCGFSSDGLPFGLQIAGRMFDERTVLKTAHAYEQATDWHTRRPPI